MERKIGKSTGYDFEDGVYYPCPRYVEEFLDISDRRGAANQLVETVTQAMAVELARLNKEQRRLWDTIEEDYGQKFGPGSGWIFRYRDSAILHSCEEQPDA